MKILWLLLLAFTLEAKILEVKQLFNLQKVSVKKISIEDTKIFYGKTEIDESRIKDVTLRFDAFINKLFVDKEYQYIKKSQPLFNIYSKEAISTHHEFIISKSISKAAKIDAVRKLKLLGLSELTKTSRAIYDFNFKSPYSGYVIEKNINDGGFIKKGKTLLKIADFSKLWVIAKVYQKDITFIEKGMKATINIDGFEPTMGKIDFIYPTLEKKDKTIKVRIILDNPNLTYFPNLFAKIEFKKTKREILALPKSAVLQKAGKYYVFVPVGDAEFEPKEIKAKRLNSDIFEIQSGLNEKQIVIDKALFMLDSDALTNSLYDNLEDEDW
jgi:Cu(I)/Ag(I) efflux system membrane fusion protein